MKAVGSMEKEEFAESVASLMVDGLKGGSRNARRRELYGYSDLVDAAVGRKLRDLKDEPLAQSED